LDSPAASRTFIDFRAGKGDGDSAFVDLDAEHLRPFFLRPAD